MENEDNSQALQLKKIRKNMSEESRVPFEENPKNDFLSTKLCGNVDSPANKILTNMNEESRNYLVSTELCLFDKTWPPWNTTKTDIDEKTESSIKIVTSKSQKPRNDFVSTELCLFDKTWPCGNSNYLNEQTRKMDMEQNQIGSNDFVTLAARNEESTEQTRKMEDDTDSEQHQMGLSMKKKTLIKHKQDICLGISKTYFDANLLRYLSEDDQKKMKLGYGVRVNVYEYESKTTDKEVVLIQSRTFKQKYLLIGTWFQRRGLQAGDKIGFYWDCSRSMFHFRVLSRETAQGKTSTAEVISG